MLADNHHLVGKLAPRSQHHMAALGQWKAAAQARDSEWRRSPDAPAGAGPPRGVERCAHPTL
eukprot:12907527-Prorocentrum_lima.AAC.1